MCNAAQLGHPHSKLHISLCKTLMQVSQQIGVVTRVPAAVGLNLDDKG